MLATRKTACNCVGRLCASYTVVGDTVRVVSNYTDDGKSRVTAYTCGMAGATGGSLGQTYGYTYDDESGTMSSMTVTASGVSDTISFTYDALQRLTAKTLARTGLTLAQTYAYKTISGNRTSTLISGLTQKTGGSTTDSYTYTYDSLGNITAINRNGNRTGYAYDAQNQLTAVSEDNISYGYTYDTYGNILSAVKYDDEELIILSTDTYSYNDPQWIDRLTAFNGHDIIYDEIGNPLTYYNGNDYAFTWNGRELATAIKGSTSVSYKYGADGLRTQKTVGNTVYNYYYIDGVLVRQTWGTNYMDFLYDETGSAYSFIYNGTQYYYVRNLQGDVVKILNTSGGVVASYTYDAWGKVTSSGNVVGQYNPIRYRGYYYDTDTGFYYLQSRYYDPAIKRFISADDASLLGANGDFTSLNLYAYCGNNPVARADNGGEAWHILIGAGVGALSSFVASVATQCITKKGEIITKKGGIDWNAALISAGYGAITGALVAAYPSAAPYINGAMSVVESLVDDCLLSNEKVSPKEVVSNAAISGTFGLITGAWDNDIVDNKALINNSVHSLKNVLFSGVNPTVRKTSTKLVRKFNRFIVKTSWNSAKETVGISFLTEGTKQIANVILWGV